MTTSQRLSAALMVLAFCVTVAGPACRHVQQPPGGASVVPALAPAQLPEPAQAPDVIPDVAPGPDAQRDDMRDIIAGLGGVKKPAWVPHFVAEVDLRGAVGPAMAAKVDVLVTVINGSHHVAAADPVEALVLVVDTGGGRLDSAEAIVRSLQGLEVPLVCVIANKAYSAGFFIIEGACPLRLAVPWATMMVHEAYREGRDELVSASQWDFQSMADALRVENDAWLALCAARMHLPLSVLQAKTRHLEWWMTAGEALAHGALDAVVANISADVVLPLQARMALPQGLGLPAGALAAPAAPVP